MISNKTTVLYQYKLVLLLWHKYNIIKSGDDYRKLCVVALKALAVTSECVAGAGPCYIESAVPVGSPCVMLILPL